jgi:hypothetical protein
LHREIGPAQAGVALAAKDQVDAPAPRVGVDEQRFRHSRRRLRQRRRKYGRTGPAPACDHANDVAATTHVG